MAATDIVDDEATEKLFQEVETRLRSFIGRRVSSPFDRDDIVQDVLMRLQTHISELKSTRQMTSWLFATARNAVVDHYRSRGRKYELHAERAAAEDLTPTLNRELATCLTPMLSQLPAHDRDVLKLSLSGMSLNEISRHLKLSLTCAKSRAQRGRKRLKSLLLNCCHVQTDRRGNVLEVKRRKKVLAYPCACPPAE